MRLDELGRHQCGMVKEIEAPGEDMVRLMSMGICRGRTVELIQKGDPLILKVYGSRIGVSRRLAQRIIIDACGPECCRLEQSTSQSGQPERDLHIGGDVRDTA